MYVKKRIPNTSKTYIIMRDWRVLQKWQPVGTFSAIQINSKIQKFYA